MQIYRDIFQDDPMVCIPGVVKELSTKRLLTMDWLSGKRVLEFVDAPQEERDRLGVLLFESWYKPFYAHGVIHGDPHPGNYTIDDKGRLNLLDFGCIRVFPKTFIGGVINLYRALQNNDRDLLVHAFETWGFDVSHQEVIDAMSEWAKLLYAPLLTDKKQPIQENLDGSVGWETATKVHETLAKFGGVSPPREFVFMDRAAVGIGSVIMRLKSEANWHRIFESLLEGWDGDKTSCA